MKRLRRRHSFKRLFTSVLVSLTFMGTVTGTASAERQSEAGLVNEVMNSENPQETYKALSKVDKEIFLRAMSPSSVEQSVSVPVVTATRSSGSCKTANHHQDWKSNYGFVVATSWLSMEWCSSGNTVTSVRITNQGGETSTPGYTYQGVLNSGTRASGPSGRAYSEIGLKLLDSVDFVNLLPALHPCIKHTGYADGHTDILADVNAGNGCRQV